MGLATARRFVKEGTGGALNWEGPVYWRSAAPEIVPGIESYDIATGRQNSV